MFLVTAVLSLSSGGGATSQIGWKAMEPKGAAVARPKYVYLGLAT